MNADIKYADNGNFMNENEKQTLNSTHMSLRNEIIISECNFLGSLIEIQLFRAL